MYSNPVPKPRSTILFFSCIICLVLATGGKSWAEPDADTQISGGEPGSQIVITTTARTAGAISSLKWHGKEFLDATDHGRELQSACSFDIFLTNPPNSEPFNPTEAGSLDDGGGPNTTSHLLEIHTSGNELETSTQMAFWLKPGETSQGQPARNTCALSDVLLMKDVRIGIEHWPQALDYRVTFRLPKEKHNMAQFEALTGYMPPEFSQFWRFDSAQNKLVPLSPGPGEIQDPVVLATPDGGYAMGIFAPRQGDKQSEVPAYGRWNFTDFHVVKWNCVFRIRSSTSLEARDYQYRMLVPIGTLAEVEQMIREWTKEGM